MCDVDNATKMESNNTALEPPSSSGMSSDAARNQHCNRLKTQPDLLNLKKGWMMQKDTEGQWQKHWFVLTDQSLRFYRDSGAEEAGDVVGEINVSTCYDITDYPAEKNYGFQMHTKEGVYSLCAMTAGIKHSWVQAVLKNVRPTLTPDVTSSIPEPRTPLKSQRSESQTVGAVGNTARRKSNTEVWYKTVDWTEATRQQKTKQDPVRGRSGSTNDSSEMSPDSLSPVASLASSLPSSSSSQSLGDLLNREEEEGQNSGRSLSHQRPLVIGPPQTAGVTDAARGLARSQYEEGIGGDSSTSTLEPQDTVQAEPEHKKAREEHTGKELEQMQRELSRLQQFNRSLQAQLQQEREYHSKEGHHLQNGLQSTSNTTAQAMAMKRLQKINHDLRFELEAQRRSQEEARDAELRRRVDLLAQQAHLLVTGDATALAQAHLEQDRRCFQEQREEWQRSIASLRSQLHLSEEQRRDTENCLLQQQQQAAQDYQTLQKEAGGLRECLQEVTTQLRANEEAQAEKEDRLQKHLVLLQESQERERRSMAASVAQAERHAQDLRDRLERAEQQVESLNKDQSWARQVDEAQLQLQEELACTVSSVQRLQEDREQINRRCQELQNQLAEADGEMSRLQNRLKTEETDYYNMEHSYERVCEELQLALGQVKSSQADAQDIREGYERLFDMKEQELSEVLLKMEILGNSLEETEEKLSDVLKVCTCASSQLERLSSSEPVQHDKGQQHSTRPPLEVNDTLLTVTHTKQLSSSLSNVDVAQLDGDGSHAQRARTRSHSLDPSYRHVMSARDDPEKFMSVIRVLETKLNVTEEKLRDVTQNLEEHQSHVGCQDPHLCSQLTQSRATAQHLSLLLHNQAKQSKRFAQETEYRFKVLLDRIQFALESVEACRERLQPLLKNPGQSGMYTDTAVEFDKQLASAAACLRQGEKDAEHQQQECQYTCTAMNDKLPETEVEIDASEDIMGIGRTLLREAGLVEKMVSVLQSPCAIGHLQLVSREAEGDLPQQYKSIISQTIALEIKKRIQQGETDGGNGESVESTIGRVCVEAELIYAALTLQRLHECTSLGDLPVKDQVMTHLWQGALKGGDLFYVPKGLVSIRSPELALCEGKMQQDGRDLEQDGKQVDEGQSVNRVEAVRDHDWLNRLVSKLQRRAKVLHRLHQDICDCGGPDTKNSEDYSCESAINLKWVEDQAKLIYMSDRLYLDFEQELERMKVMCDRLKDLCQQNNIVRTDEQQAFSNTISQLQQDNNILREQLDCAEQNIMAAATGNQRLLEDMQKIEDRHEERMQTLEMEFQEKIRELQQIHEDEMKHLHSYYAKSAGNYRDTQNKPGLEAAPPTENTTSPSHLTLNSALAPDELKMLGWDDQLSSRETKEGQMNRLDVKVKSTKEEPGYRTMERDPVAMREAYQRDFEKLKASCEQGFSAMEEMHRKLVCDLKQQHQREVAALLQQKDHLLKEETAATVTAIVAMRKAHKEELERRSCWPQHVAGSADISQLHTEYQKEIQLLRKELETLSVQHTQKCLENAHMSQQLEAERQAFSQCQQENQWMKDKQEMTDKVVQEISHMRCSPKGKQPEATTQAKLYEMEVFLRLKEAELQCLKQEALSLREDLKTAVMDKTYAMDRLEALCANSHDTAQHDSSNLSEDSQYATCSPDSMDDDAAQQKMTWQQPEAMLILQRKYLSPIEELEGGPIYLTKSDV